MNEFSKHDRALMTTNCVDANLWMRTENYHDAGSTVCPFVNGFPTRSDMGSASIFSETVFANHKNFGDVAVECSMNILLNFSCRT